MVNAKDPRPPVPAAMKREVRARCGFGCVICGKPLYDYDHLVDYSIVQKHEAANLVLLCQQHHREKTDGLLPLKLVIEANDNPFNVREGVSAPYRLHYSGHTCSMRVGGNWVTTQDPGKGLMPFVIDDFMPFVFRVHDAELFLDVLLFDEFNRPVLRIHENELVYSMDSWDIEFTGRNLVIRAGKGSIFIDVTFEPPDRIVIARGRILYAGVEVLISPDYLWLVNGGGMIRGNSIVGNYGLVIGEAPTPNAIIRCRQVNRYMGPTPEQSHARAREELKRPMNPP